MSDLELSKVDEAVLVIRARSGDEHSFSQLVERYEQRVLYFILRFVDDVDIAYERVELEFHRTVHRPDTYVRLDGVQLDSELRYLGPLASDARFGLDHLSVGQLALEIDGQDIFGQSFTLSDYRGKVVLLAFSGNWCGSCVAMYPQYRELVKRHKDRPFALLHVNSDSSRKEVVRDTDDGKITWKCWWDGGRTDGPIATQWQVKAWPAIYVLDHTGTIRHKDLRGAALDRAVEILLRQAESQR